MPIFIDTSAMLAVLNRDDLWAVRAGRAWRELVETGETLRTTSYVVLETTSILQRRLGLEAVRTFCNGILPVIDVAFVDAHLHSAAMSSLLVANRRNLSLVDCCSFEFMRRNELHTALAYDRHFCEQGFFLYGEIPEESL